MSSDTATTTFTTIEGLDALVGHELGVSSWREVTAENVRAFADLTGDHNPIHIDDEAGAGSPFGTTIVHGYFTLALVVPMMAEFFEVTDAITRVNYGLNRLRFPAPVPVGGRIRVRSVMTAVDEIPDGRQIAVTSTFELDGGAKPVAVADMLLRYSA